MTKTEKTQARKYYLYFGPVVSIISFLVVFFVLNLLSVSTPNNAVPAASFAILILLITNFFTIQKEVEKTTDEIEKASVFSDKIYEAVKNYLHIIKLGNPVTAVAYIESNISRLVEAKNTSMNWGDEYLTSDKKFYDTDKYDQFQNTLLKNVGERGLFWREIGDSTAIERFRKTRVAAMDKERPDRYQYKLLSSQFGPQINFIILEYNKEDSEVLFNWDFQSPGDTPQVLLSRDPHIVKMFAVHFENLWKCASLDHDNDINATNIIK